MNVIEILARACKKKKKKVMNSRKHCLIFRNAKKKRNSKPKPSLEKYQFVQSCYRPCTQSPKAVIPACLYFPWKIPRLEFLYSINIENLSKWIKLHQPSVSSPPMKVFQNYSLVFARILINTKRDLDYEFNSLYSLIIISFDNIAIRFYLRNGKMLLASSSRSE